MDPDPNSSPGPSKPAEEDKQFKCEDCDASFAHKRTLIRHDFAVHWSQSHQCSCGKQFPRRDVLKRHKRACPGVLITGTIVNILPLDSLLGPKTAIEGTPTPKLGHSLVKKQQPDYIIRKQTPKVAPWKRPSSAVFTPSKKPLTQKESKKLEIDLFGEDDDVPTPSCSSQPTKKKAKSTIEIDLYLSSDSDTDVELEFSDPEVTIEPLNESATQDAPADHQDMSLQDCILKVLSDLTTIQEANAKGSHFNWIEIQREIEYFHGNLQELLKTNP